RIAANAITDHHHRTVRDRHLSADLEPVHEAHDCAERRASLYRAVRDLPTDQRRVIEMRFAEGRSIAEIARTLGPTGRAVKQLQFRPPTGLRAPIARDDA